MKKRNSRGKSRRNARLGLRCEGLEGREMLSITPMLYAIGAIPAVHPVGSMATVQPAVTHQPTRRGLALETFSARFKGNFQASPGLYTDQRQQMFIAASGNSSCFLHGDIEMAIYLPVNPSTPAYGQAFMIVKNYGNTGNSLGVDLTADPTSLDAHGRPTRFTWTVNGNSGGAFASATGSGTLQVLYLPPFRNVNSQFPTGRIGLIFSGKIVTSRVTNSVRFT